MSATRAVWLAAILLPGHAQSLACEVIPVEARYRASKHVFVAQVVGATLVECVAGTCAAPGPRAHAPESVVVSAGRTKLEWRGIVARVQVTESFKKDDPPTELRVTNWGYARQVAVGAHYLVYADGSTVSLDCGGMTRLSGDDPGERKLLRELRTLQRAR